MDHYGSFRVSTPPRFHPALKYTTSLSFVFSLLLHFSYSNHQNLPILHLRIYYINMSWQKTVLSPGNGTDMPAVGANVKIDYTGWLRDPSNPDHEKGKEYVYFPSISKAKVCISDSGVIDSTPPKAAVHWLLLSAEVGSSRVSYLLRRWRQGEGGC